MKFPSVRNFREYIHIFRYGVLRKSIELEHISIWYIQPNDDVNL